MKIIVRILSILCVIALFLFLPAIPVLSAPVIPNPQPEMISLSLWDILSAALNPLLGVAVTWEWYSYLALVLLLAIMVAVSLLIAFIRL